MILPKKSWYMIGLLALMGICIMAAGCSDRETLDQEYETSQSITGGMKESESPADSRKQAETSASVSELSENPILQAEPARWSVNTKIATSIPSLDYADDEIVMMHDYFGLFICNLDTGGIEASIDLQSLGYEFHNDSSSKIVVSQDGKFIWIWPEASQLPYTYEWKPGKLTRDDDISGKTTFDRMMLTKDIPSEMLSGKSYRFSKQAVLFPDESYGTLYVKNERITGICFVRDDKEWVLFSEKNCTAPELVRQKDAFYEQIVYESSRSADALMFAYCTMIDYGEYAGICALSQGVTYSEETQKQWNGLELTTSSKEIKTTDDRSCFQVYIIASDSLPESHLERGMNETYLYIRKNEDHIWYADGFLHDAEPDEEWWS